MGYSYFASVFDIVNLASVCSLNGNQIGEEAEQALRDAMKGRDGFELGCTRGRRHMLFMLFMQLARSTLVDP